MRLILASLLMMAIAASVGLGATWVTATRGANFGAVTIGPWTTRPKTGTTDIDPYARAQVARSGILPVGSGDGVSFVAAADGAGRPLDGRCDVLVSGVTPAARYWTLALYDARGDLVANGVERHSFTSQEVVRNAKGEIEIRLAPRARAGNWLPTGGIDRYVLVMRLYDTPVGVTTRTQRDAPMPDIEVQGCP